MDLMPESQVKSDALEKNTAQEERISALNAEETELTRSLDEKRTSVADEKAALSAELETYRQEIAIQRANVIASLESEVRELESRKVKALEPLDARDSSQNLREAGLNDRELGIIVREQEIAEKNAALDTRDDGIKMGEQVNNSRALDLDQKEKDLDIRHEDLLNKEVIFRNDRTEFDIKMIEADRLIRNYTSALETSEKAVDSRAAEVDAKAQDNLKERRLIESNYKAIETAKEHLGIE